jgi:hypothetical protein
MAFKGSQKDPILSIFNVAQMQPDGTMAISRNHGMYSKVVYEPKTEKVTAAEERLVLLLKYNYPGPHYVKLIEIKGDSYTVIASIDVKPLVEGNALSASWNYKKNKFLVFTEYSYLYEVSIEGVAQLVARYDPYADDWYSHPTGTHNYPILFHSYGANGDGNLMWFGFSEYYYGYYYVLPINDSYGFVKKGVLSAYAFANPDTYSVDFLAADPNKYLEIALADCDSYHHATYNVPTLSWVTHNNVRILKPVTNLPENWYGQANQRVCEVMGKAAVVFDEDIQNGWAPMAVRLCQVGFVGAGTFGTSGMKETPTSYMDNTVTVMRSEIFATGTANYNDIYYEEFWQHGWELVACSIVSVSAPYLLNGAFYIDVKYSVTPSGGDPLEFTHTFSNYSWTTNEPQAIMYTPDGGGGMWVNDPNGTPQYLTDPAGEFGVYSALIIVWHRYPSGAYWVQRENYGDMRFVNNHYVIVGEENITWNLRLFVADKNGTEKYEIPWDDPGDVLDVRLERVIVR